MVSFVFSVSPLFEVKIFIDETCKDLSDDAETNLETKGCDRGNKVEKVPGAVSIKDEEHLCRMGIMRLQTLASC